ncbi:MAG: sigma 54-interacting transcriptional regulator [Desulfovibrio sp.]|jgi:propionate catabolism operon transcriptional regulator|nr:sigma 54-interacting transcriptional regulator [Desulfovibrio sp.]
MSAKIAIMSYRALTNFLSDHPSLLDLPGVDVHIESSCLDDVLSFAQRLEDSREIDVFVSSGANGRLLSKYLHTPLLLIQITGFDLLQAMGRLDTARPIAVLSFDVRIPFLEESLPCIVGNLFQEIYYTRDGLLHTMDRLKKQGVEQVIGGSMVMEAAEECGMRSSFIYSEDSITRAINAAAQMALLRQRDRSQAQWLNAIITYSYSGIMATDAQGVVTTCNPVAAKILGIRPEAALSQRVSALIPNTRVLHVIREKKSELNQIQKIGKVTVITNRVPIVDEHGCADGCVLTFHDVETIRKAEAKVRKKEGGVFQARTRLDDIIGQSRAIVQARRRAYRYASSSASVFIFGETGTGKELIAQGIHLASSRAHKPFIAVNCAALPATLLESELFGYEDGAFTGARCGGKPGFFELAHGGTIFLDEIGELSLSVQARLLRVLEEREVLRVGGTQVISVDVRLISASNADIQRQMEQKLFRPDLFHRVNVLRLTLPPLREREGDVLILAKHFAHMYHAGFDETFLEGLFSNSLLLTYAWPGNVRELRNVIEAATALYHEGCTPGALLLDLDLPLCEGRVPPALARKKTDIARELGISRTTLWRRSKGR